MQKSAGIASGPVSFLKVYDVALSSISRMDPPPGPSELFSTGDTIIGCAPLDIQVARGPVEFMNVYNSAFQAIAQGGTRRGASMGVLRVDHPDIMEFVCCKSDQTTLNGFNISVGITDKFMKCVVGDLPFDLVNPRTNAVVKTMKAREIMDEIVKNAHRNGEPGVLFLDELNRKNPMPHMYKIETTNPCGEQALGPYEVRISSTHCNTNIPSHRTAVWDRSTLPSTSFGRTAIACSERSIG